MERSNHVLGTTRTDDKLAHVPGGSDPGLHPLSPFPVVPEAEPLDRLIGAPLELGRFLRLSVAISAGLHELHAHGVVHKDGKQAHLLVDPVSEITVKAHRGKVMRKMKADSLPGLVTMAARLGLRTAPKA